VARVVERTGGSLTGVAGRQRSAKRQRGTLEPLPSGAIRVRVYAGVDPVTKRRHELRETIPAGPQAERLAEHARVRLLNEVYQRRQPRTNATVNELLDRYFKQADWELNTLETYRGYAKKHIRPFIGEEKIGALDDGVVDSLYAELRRCRDHCVSPRGIVDHRTKQKHECDNRCTPHRCKPLRPSTIRQIHFILYGAVGKAVRWKWVSANPIGTVEPPAKPKSNPRPPSPEQAARIVSEAFKDPEWGTLVWLTMVTGHRRGELCAIRWRHLDLVSGVLHLERAIGQRGTTTWEKDTKDHQDRRITLDSDTLQILVEHRARVESRALFLRAALSDESFVFSRAADGSAHLLPDSVGQRFRKLTARLGIDSSIHKLRHYSATELIAAGVDVRTVAGRLGHGGGGTTTLNTYAAWLSEADQRAAGNLAARMPARPTPVAIADTSDFVAASPYEEVAVRLRDKIAAGALPPGMALPGVTRLAGEYAVAPSTARRALQLLNSWGLVTVANGRPTLVCDGAMSRRNAPPDEVAATTEAAVDWRASSPAVEALDIELQQRGRMVIAFRTEADPTDTAELHQLLAAAVRRGGGQEADLGDYELIVRYAGERGIAATFVATARATGAGGPGRDRGPGDPRPGVERPGQAAPVGGA
jgi:integrase